MEGMERIKESILAEANAQAATIIKETKKNIKEMERKVIEEAKTYTQNRLVRAETEAEEAEKRMLSMAGLDLRKQDLGIKQSLINQVFQKALDRLKALTEEEYAAMVISILANANLTGNEELIVSQRDRQRFQQGLLKRINDELGFKLKLADETRDMQGGFIIKINGVEMNNSFEILLRMEREKIETDIASILFQQ